jgi:hypothetical protein
MKYTLTWGALLALITAIWLKRRLTPRWVETRYR